MHELTYKNHFRFGYDNEWFRFRQTPEDEWMVSYGLCERPYENFKQECYATARLIRDNHTGPLSVLFSGGADSEVVIRSFHDQHIPFNAYIIQFNDNLNIHDVSYAVVCCQQLGIRYRLVPLNIRRFLDDEVYTYAEATQPRSPELCSTMWLADQVDGIPIIGSGECYVAKRVPPSYVDGISEYDPTPWDLYERELIASWYRHFMLPGKERQAVPGFFQYTPEIMMSFLTDRRVVDLVNDRVIGKRSTLTSKLGIYQKYFPLANRKKYNGYEKLYDRVLDLRVQFRRQWPSSAAIFLTEYNDLIGMLDGRIEGPKGTMEKNMPLEMMTKFPSESDAFIDDTRQLNDSDYEQVVDLIEERFSTIVEYSNIKHRNFVSIDEDSFNEFKDVTMAAWKATLSNTYLKGRTHKLFGSFHRGKLMSMVGMRLVLDSSWVLSNLKARNVPLSETGLKETMIALFRAAKELDLTEYYCCIAKYRYEKFQIFMNKLVPKYYAEYEGEILDTILAGDRPSVDFWWGMMGRKSPVVDVVIKKMKLKN